MGNGEQDESKPVSTVEGNPAVVTTSYELVAVCVFIRCNTLPQLATAMHLICTFRSWAFTYILIVGYSKGTSNQYVAALDYLHSLDLRKRVRLLTILLPQV